MKNEKVKTQKQNSGALEEVVPSAGEFRQFEFLILHF
jgi:hypothetical protein